MSEVLHMVLRSAHILFGTGAFVLGALAVFLPKFGWHSGWHRWIGRAYAVARLGMGALSVPLSIRNHDWLLLVIGLITLFWVVGGWLALRQWQRSRAAPLMARHIIFMGSSYGAAWTAFLINIRPLGGGTLPMILYITLPSIVAGVAITRTMVRQRAPGLTKRATSSEASISQHTAPFPGGFFMPEGGDYD